MQDEMTSLLILIASRSRMKYEHSLAEMRDVPRRHSLVSVYATSQLMTSRREYRWNAISNDAYVPAASRLPSIITDLHLNSLEVLSHRHLLSATPESHSRRQTRSLLPLSACCCCSLRCLFRHTRCCRYCSRRFPVMKSTCSRS